jgi:hypothetical protein
MRWRAASTARRGLTVLFAINAVGAGAAAVVLAFAPGAIPSIAGIAIDPSQNLLPYLLAAAELALASLAALAIRSPSAEVKRISVGVLVVFHAASAVAGLAAVTEGAGIVVVMNVAVRAVMIAALVVCAPPRPVIPTR